MKKGEKRGIPIPKKYYEEIQTKAVEGFSVPKIVQWLMDTYQVKTSTRSLSRILSELKAERKEVALRAYADSVAKYANQDLRILGEMITKLYNKVNKCFKDKDKLIPAQKLSETLLKYLSKRMDLSGLNQKDELANDERIKEELLHKIEEYKKE